GQDFYHVPFAAHRQTPAPRSEGELMQRVGEHRQRFVEFMDDDFNTGGAIGDLFDLVKTLNRYVDTAKLDEAATRTPAQLDALREAVGTLRELSATLGLFRQPAAKPKSGDDELLGRLVGLFIELRAEARKAKNFAVADRIRAGLTELGITLEDRADGTGWTLKR
ncbi:MAG TPA: DALR domain-containing protein, partial [Pirellulales bacterium]